MKKELLAWIFVIGMSSVLWLGISVITYDKGYLAGRKDQQMKDFNIGGIILQNREERIKQLESALTAYKIEIPK